MIEVRGLTKYYGPTLAIENLDFEVKKGEILGFLGPNAAGKTTTLRILTGFLPPTRGTAKVAGFDVVEESLQARRQVGYVPERVPLYGDLTPLTYLRFMAKLRGIPKDDREKKVAAAMKTAAIEHVAQTLIGKLSLGYRQRVGLAQALLHEPDVLVLDEPTIGLDPAQIIEMRNLIKNMAGQRTVILSSHILPEVSQTCQRVVIINQGHIVAEDTPDRLTARLHKSSRVLVRLSKAAPEAANRLRALPGVISVTAQNGGQALVVESRPDTDVRPQMARTVVESGADLLELRPVEMTLEEIFLRLTTSEEGITQ